MAELLSNNPRLISPCIDVPLASVQVERTDSLELIPIPRKTSGSVSNSRKQQQLKPSLAIKDNSSGREPLQYQQQPPESHAYSPMDGGGCGTVLNGGSSNPFNYSNPREPLLSRGSSSSRDQQHRGGKALDDVGGSNCKEGEDHTDYAPKVSSSLLTAGNSGNSPYVPPGYIMLDHCDSTAVATLATAGVNDYVPSSV